mmetsp:Transcript_9936/g.19612  ORF Transcript_9936/g.19612 Transcript_9936/m.19612 type:complete len:93 (-) Transcript_9936:1425-1703(-)
MALRHCRAVAPRRDCHSAACAHTCISAGGTMSRDKKMASASSTPLHRFVDDDLNVFVAIGNEEFVLLVVSRTDGHQTVFLDRIRPSRLEQLR